MSTEATVKPTLRQKATNELLEFVFLFCYLYLSLGALILLKLAILHDQGIEFVPWGIAAIKAALLAKFIMLGNIADVSRRFASRPLIWPTIIKAASLLVVLIVLTITEEAIVGLVHHRAVADSLSELASGKLAEAIASILILLLILIPYCAWDVLGKALGEGRLAAMFFKHGEAGFQH